MMQQFVFWLSWAACLVLWLAVCMGLDIWRRPWPWRLLAAVVVAEIVLVVPMHFLPLVQPAMGAWFWPTRVLGWLLYYIALSVASDQPVWPPMLKILPGDLRSTATPSAAGQASNTNFVFASEAESVAFEWFKEGDSENN